MLQSLHGAAKQWVGLLLFVMLILSFVIWGIADVFQGNVRQKSVVKVGDLEISAQQLQNEVRQQISTMSQLTGRVLSLKEAAEFGLIARTVQILIDRAILEQEANRLGLHVPDDIILSTLRDIPQLKKPDGTFDAAAFRAALANAGMTEQGYILSQRITLAREQLAKSVTAGAGAPSLLLQALAAAKAETRTIETYQVKYAAQPAPATPTDDILNGFIKENAAQFTRPEYRKLSFIHLSAETVGQDMAVDDADIAKAYEDRKDEFNLPEQRSFVQVVVGDKAAADALSAAAKGKNLTDVAKAQGAEAAILPNIGRDDLPEEIRDTAFKLGQKEISAPVESMLGWHVLQLTGSTPAREQKLADVKDKLIADIRSQRSGDLIVKESQQLDDLLASGASLDEIGPALNLPVQQVSAIDATGKDDKGNPVNLLTGKPTVLAEGFRLAEGAQSNLITVDDDYYVVRAESVQPSALKPLTEVKAAATTAYIQAEQKKQANARATDLAKALGAGQSFEGAANQFKAESSIERNLTRDATLPSYLPEGFGEKIFALQPNEVTQIDGKGSALVVRLQKIDHPLAIADAKIDPQAVTPLKDDLSGEMLESYTAALKSRYPVSVDRDQINSLFASNDAEDAGQ